MIENRPARAIPHKLTKPIPHHPDWGDAEYAAEILARIELLLAHYEIDVDNLRSQDDAVDALCRVLFDWVPGLRAEHMLRPVASAPAGAVFGDAADARRPGVAQPVSSRLDEALRQYRTMDPKQSRREELQRFIERSVAVDVARARKHRHAETGER